MNSTVRTRILAVARLSASAVAIAAVGLVASDPAYAQLAVATLRGRAAPNTEVVVTQPSTGAVRRTTSSDDGTFVIAGLQPGGYHVTAGDRSADVAISVASVSDVDLTAPVGSQGPTVTGQAGARPGQASQGDVVVTGTRPTVEVRTSQVNQIVTLHDIAALPQVTRNFLEFADIVPGMQFSIDQGHKTSLRGGAQLDSAGNIYIDGVSQKDYVGSGGGTSGSGSGFAGSGGADGKGDPGNPFPQLAIGEYKVVTSNYSAEFGDASSAIILAQTKSGTNTFHGEGFFDFTGEHLRAERPDEKAAGKGKAHEPSKEYGVALGGPIIKDIAHFFFTWEHKSLSDSVTVYPGGAVPASAIALLPKNVTGQFGPVTNPFTENLYFGKVDVEPTSRDRFEFTGNFRLERNFSGAGGQNAQTTEVPYTNDVKRGDARWQHNGDRWVNVVRASYQYALSAAQATIASPQFDYYYFPNSPDAQNSNQNSSSIINVGGPGSGVGVINKQKGWTFADDLAFNDIQFAGNHTLRLGASYGSIQLSTQNASSDLANATYYYAVTGAGVASTPYYVQYPSLVAGYSSAGVTTRDKQYALFIQDDWNVTPKLTFNLGLRWDREIVPSYVNYQTPAAVVSALNGPYCTGVYSPCTTTATYASVLATSVPGAPGININDYISTGHNRRARNNFSPRLGFSYDVRGDSSFVIFGGYARAYDRNLFSQLALETTKVALNNNPQVSFPSPQSQAFGPCRTEADVNPTNHCYAFDPSYLTPAGLATLQTSPTSHEVDLLRNNIRTPHSDQFSLGIRNRIGQWNTQATVSYVESFDNIYGHWGERYQDGQFYKDGIQWGAQGVPGIGTLILFDNGFKDRNFQFSLAGQKPYTRESGWSATVTYTFSAAVQNNSYAYGASSNNYLFDYPTAASYPFLRSNAVPRHRLVMTGSVDMPLGLQLAGKLTLAVSEPTTVIYGCSANAPSCNATTSSTGQTIYVNSIGGSTAGFVSYRPKPYLGYKDIDLQLTKNLTLFNRLLAYVRVDAINIFNWHNYDPLATNVTFVKNVPTTVAYNRIGPIIGSPFTAKLTAGIRF